VPTEALLPPASLSRYADAIVKASLAVGKGDTFVVVGEPEHRELLAAVAVSAYKAGAQYVDVVTSDPLVSRARLMHGNEDALGALAPWTRRRLREASGPNGATAYITGEGEAGYLNGVPPERIATDYQRFAKQVGFVRRAQLNMESRWSIAGWPADHWARQVYPNLEVNRAKRKLAKDLLYFCRLTDADGAGTSGWTKHLKTLTRRGAKLT
jgi:leucyl aminopeptidase (aminopeptidase T)